jgi:hypothetical protein
MRDAADDLATVLAAAGLGLTKGTNLFIGPMPEAGLSTDGYTAPDKCVSVQLTGGSSPEGFVGQGKKALLHPRCQVMIRGNRDAFALGQALAFGVFEALNQTAPSPYVSVTVRESSPFFGGPDDKDRPQWSLNVDLTYLNAPT